MKAPEETKEKALDDALSHLMELCAPEDAEIRIYGEWVFEDIS